MSDPPRKPPWRRALDAMPAIERDAIEHHAASFRDGPARRYFIRRLLVELDVRDGNRKLAPPSIVSDGLDDLRTPFGRDVLKRREAAALTALRELRAARGAHPRCARCGNRAATTTAPDPYTDEKLDVCNVCAGLIDDDRAEHALNLHRP